MLTYSLSQPEEDMKSATRRDNALKLKIKKMLLQGKSEQLKIASEILNPTSGVHKILALEPRAVQLWEAMAPDGIVDHKNVIHLGDVTNSKNVVRMLGKYRSADEAGSVHQVISTHSNDKWNDSFIAMDLLHEGGRYTLDIDEAYDKNMQILLWILSECFDNVVIRKPATSIQTNSYKFVVCTCFKASTFRTRFRERFREIALEPLLLGDECPVVWFSHMSNMQNYFTKQAEACQHQAVQLSDMFQAYGIKDLVQFKEICDKDHNLRKYLHEFVQHKLQY
jgi:hypothetical protein